MNNTQLRFLIITKQYIKDLIVEELTKTDVKKLIDDAIDKSEKRILRQLPKELEKELQDALKSKEIKSLSSKSIYGCCIFNGAYSINPI